MKNADRTLTDEQIAKLTVFDLVAIASLHGIKIILEPMPAAPSPTTPQSHSTTKPTKETR